MKFVADNRVDRSIGCQWTNTCSPPSLKPALGRSQGGIPIGSVLVCDPKFIARGHNKRVQEKNPILHGEMNLLDDAGRIGSYKGTVVLIPR